MQKFLRHLIIDEKTTVEWMIRFYCRKKHGVKELCDHCSELINYAADRITRCPHGKNKPVCSRCTIHCYKKDYRAKIIKVMRFSGPRIIFHKPLTGIKYLLKKKFLKGL